MSGDHDVVRREFTRQADGFGQRASFFAAGGGTGLSRAPAGRARLERAHAPEADAARVPRLAQRGSGSSPCTPDPIFGIPARLAVPFAAEESLRLGVSRGRKGFGHR